MPGIDHGLAGKSEAFCKKRVFSGFMSSTAVNGVS
jgi:hypothetical protein